MKKSLKIALITSVTVAFIFSFTLINKKVSANSAVAVSYADSKALNLVNEYRVQNGLSSLRWNDQLSAAAYLKAQDMVQNNYFEHVSPNGKTAWNFIDKSGYEYMKAGENLAIDFNSLDDTYKAWENSPSHRENLLSDNYTDFGFASTDGVIDGQKTTISVQIFASQMPIYDRVLSNLGGQNGS